MNIAEILRSLAATQPAAPAIIDSSHGRDRVTTYRQLEMNAARGAALVKHYGLRQGDTALIFQPMSSELYTALLALFRLGITAMFLDPSAGLEHIKHCCSIRSPDALIGPPKVHLLRLISPALRNIPRKFVFGYSLPGAVAWGKSQCLDPLEDIIPCDEDIPALVTFTSGSTGMPKAAVRSHGFLLEQHRVLKRALHLKPGTVDLTTLPVFVLANLASGVTSVIPDANLRKPGNIEAAPVLEQINRHNPVSVLASPAFLECVSTACETTRTALSGFHYVFTGGAPVFPSHFDLFNRTFPNSEIVAVYGSTEAEPIAHISRNEISADDITNMSAGKGLLAGMPIEEIQIRIVDAQWGRPIGRMEENGFNDMCLPAGQPGEIVVNGNHVLKGYLNGVGDSETKFSVGDAIWHRTGDCGYIDERGRLWLMGRASAVIRDSRGTLYPFAVECAAMQMPQVQRAAVLGRNGSRILYVQPRGGADVDTAALRESLAWAFIDIVKKLDRIPLDRRHNAKVDYTRLS